MNSLKPLSKLLRWILPALLVLIWIVMPGDVFGRAGGGGEVAVRWR